MGGEGDQMSSVRKDDEMKLDMEWVSSLEKRLPRTRDGHSERPTIFRVPRILKGNDPEAYEPRFVSLGPYHHDKPHLLAKNDLKWHYLKTFLGRNTSKGLADYLQQMKALEPRARAAYSEEVSMSSNEFVQMMLLDGCFVVETIVCWYDDKEDQIENTILWTRYKLLRDIFILENQLPFFLLQNLFDSAFPHPSPSDSLRQLTFKFLGSFVTIGMECPSQNKSFDHILHLLYCCIIPANNQQGGSESSTPGLCGHMLSKMKRLLSSQLCQSLLTRMNKFWCFGDDPDGNDQQSNTLEWIPSATKLNEAGIQFKRKKQAKSFLDITFQNGKMEIPQLQIDDNTNTFLRNLIALEQCSKMETGTVVAVYIALMDCIIDSAADVELLQQEEIIVHGLGDSSAVAGLFNKLFKEVVVDQKNSCVLAICKDVRKHCNTKYNKWRARLNHDYFSNPWAIISFFAAILLFILTIMQTVYTVLSYAQSPN